MRIPFSLKQGLIVIALTAASNAQAGLVKIDYTNTGAFPFTESFTIDTSAGTVIAGGLGPVLQFSISNDTSNNTVFNIFYPGSYQYFPSNYSNAIGTGNGQGFFDGLTPPIWSGSGTTASLAPGDSYATIHGGTLTVSSVPEASTWAMMLAGFAALGFVGYRRRAASAA